MLKVYRGLSVVVLVLVAVQFFLAGRGTFTAAFEAHRATGFIILPVTLVAAVAGALARAPRGAVLRSAAAAVLMVLQPVLAGLGKGLGEHSISTGGLLFGLHAVNAVAIVSLLASSVRRTSPRRQQSPSATLGAELGSAG